jgi:hypothetical protein
MDVMSLCNSRATYVGSCGRGRWLWHTGLFGDGPSPHRWRSRLKIKSRAQFLRKGALSRVGRLEEMLRSMSSSIRTRSQLAALVLGRALALAVVAKTLRLPRQAGEGKCGQRATPKPLQTVVFTSSHVISENPRERRRACTPLRTHGRDAARLPGCCHDPPGDLVAASNPRRAGRRHHRIWRRDEEVGRRCQCPRRASRR